MSHLSEKEVLAKTLWGEARGEGYDGLVAVTHVIMNRANDRSCWSQYNGWPNDIKGVCLQPPHFECWDNKRDIDVSEDRDSYEKILGMVDALKKTADPTRGANHYHNPDAPGEWEKSKEWRPKCSPTVKIGKHQFYKQVR